MDSVWGGQLKSSLISPKPRPSSGVLDPKTSVKLLKPTGKPGHRVTILSIDGVGVGGVILATILEELEAFLQEKDGSKEMRIVDYFDLIAGTSSGGLITAMLAAPKKKKSKGPKFTAAQIVDFYKQNASRIFPQPSPARVSPYVANHSTEKLPPVGNKAPLADPKYNPQGLEDLLKKHFGEKLSLKNMLKDVIIPSFDIKLRKPIFFSSVMAKLDELDDAPLHSVCRATLATPSYFPPAQFTVEGQPEGKGESGRTKEYNVIDGVVTVSNPTHVAITRAIKDVKSGRMCKKREVNPEGYGDLLVLSLGTGNQVQSFTRCFTTDDNHKNRDLVDLVDLVFNTSSDMVDYNLNIMFESQYSSPLNYLRIAARADSLNDCAVSLDDSSPANLKRLVEVGTQLLKKERDNVTGEPVPASNRETNGEALERFAGFLSEERKERLTWYRKISWKIFNNQAPTLQSAPAQNPETAVEEVVESQVEVEERAYVTFPYHSPHQFFDNPFQTSTHDMGSGSYVDASFTDPAYTGRSNFPESSESSGSWRGDQSTTTTFSDYPVDYCESGQRSYTYSESAHQMSYPEPQSTSLSSQLDQGRYQDYFNIFY